MAGEAGYPRFFAVVGLFVFSMTGLVLSNNYLLTYVFWEGVGVCSYLLVGFWHRSPRRRRRRRRRSWSTGSATSASRSRSSGCGRSSYNHDLSYSSRAQPRQPGSRLLPQAAALGIALLLFWAATAKSAQVPLYVWLPDAMEGPTPVSALIHAATMVTAGVYLIARSMPLLARSPAGAHGRRGVIGCLTALLAALIALTQTDLKRVLAYSTVSQLGYMFMALGAGVGDVAQFAVVAAMFHLFTHAFFKALLFLGSGSVMHAMGGVIDMRRFGGLRHRMPIHLLDVRRRGCSLFRDLAARRLLQQGRDPDRPEVRALEHGPARRVRFGGVYTVIYWTAVFTAFMTAFYTGRAFFMTFLGPEKLPSPDDPEAGTSPTTATVPRHDDDHGHDDATVTRLRPRVAAGDDDSADDPGRLCRSGRACLRPDRHCSSITWNTPSDFEAPDRACRDHVATRTESGPTRRRRAARSSGVAWARR